MLLLRNGEVEAEVSLPHDVAGAGVEEDRVLVEFWELGGADADETDPELPVGVEGGVGEALPFVLTEKTRVGETNVVNLVP